MTGSANEQKLEPLVNAVVNCQKGIDMEENFAILYNSTYRFVVGRLRNNELYEHELADLEDYVQNVYIYVYRHLVDLKDPRAILAWLKIIVRGTVSDSRKTARYKMKVQETAMVTRRTEDKDAEEMDPEDDDIKKNPEAMYLSNSDRDAIREVIAGLPEAQRQAIIAYFFYGKKEKEIAEELGLNLNTVKSRLKSGRDSVYKRKADLKKRGVEIAIIPLVLLLHVAYDADPALAASLMSGAAIGGASAAASAKASVETAASASKAAIGTGETAKTAGAAKAVSTGIALKALSIVAAVAVVAGGDMVYKSVTKISGSAVQISTSAASQAIDNTQEHESDTAETAGPPGAYASAYGPAVDNFVSRHNVPLNDVTIRMSDFDKDGSLEMIVYYKSASDTYTSFYTMSDGTANLVVDAEVCWIFKGIKDNKIYIRAIYPDGQLWAEDAYLLSHSSVSLVTTITPVTRVKRADSFHYRFDDEAADKDSELDDLIGNNQIRSKDIPEIKYSQLISYSDEQLTDALANYKY